MRRILALVLCLLLLAGDAFAVFSGHYFCYRRSGVTYQLRMYDSTADVGSHYIAGRISGQTYYAMLGDTSRADASYFRARVGGVTYAGIPIAHSFTTTFGSYGTGNGQFNAPMDVAVDSSGNIYVTDSGNNRVQKFDSTGAYVTKWGALGSGNGEFSGPVGIAVDSSGYVYVADTENGRIQKFNSSGTYQSQWSTPCFGVCVDSSNYVYVTTGLGGADFVRKYNSSGVLQISFGAAGTGNGQFTCSIDAYVDSSGNIYVIDSNNSTVERIQKFNSSGTYQSQWGTAGTGDGQYDFIRYFASTWLIGGGVVGDSSGNLFVSDSENDRVQKCTSAGVFITSFGSFGSGDAQFNKSGGIAYFGGKVIVVDRNNHRVHFYE